MAKARVLSDDEQTVLAEFYIADEYVEVLVGYVREAVNTYVVEEEKKKLLAEQDETLKSRVNEKISEVEV